MNDKQIKEIKQKLIANFENVSVEMIDEFLQSAEILINSTIIEQFEDYIRTNETSTEDLSNKIEEICTSDNETATDSSTVESLCEMSANDEEITSSNTSNLDEVEQVLDFASNSSTQEEFAEKKADDFVKVNFNSAKTLLPNGKVSAEYSFELTNEYIDFDAIQEFEIYGLDEIGLQLDGRKIHGTPIKDGTYKLIVNCKLNGWDENKPIIPKELSILINPDPRSLWNNIPTSSDIEYFKSDSDLNFIDVPDGKNVIVASQRGRSHAHEGIPRDDDFSISYNVESGWYILAVADGAGSAKFSRKGSSIACDVVQKVCSSQLQGLGVDLDNAISGYSVNTEDANRKKIGDILYSVLGSAAFKANKEIEKEAQDTDNKVRDYSTTLVLSIVKKFSFGWFIGSFWVGDGGIGVYRAEDSYLRVLGEPDGGEYAGQTRFLTMNEIITPEGLYKRLRFEIVNDFTSLLLMTDGVTDPMFETDASLLNPEKWKTLWTDIESKVDLKDPKQSSQQLLEWLDFWSAGNHDDRTIAILY